MSVGNTTSSILGDFKTRLNAKSATIVNAVLGLVKLEAKADVEVGDPTFTTAHFASANIRDQRHQTIKARGLLNGLADPRRSGRRTDLRWRSQPGPGP